MGGTPLGHRADFRTLFDHLEGVALWTSSQLGEFDYVSSGIEDIWGIPSREIEDDIGRMMDGVHPDDREQVLSMIERAAQELEATSYEHRVVRSDGTVRWVLARVVPLRDDEGNLSDLVGISTDITEQKRREQELEVLNRIVRHDIRNDMTVVLGWAEMLNQHVDDGGRELVRKILASGEHVVELTEIAHDYVEVVTGADDLPLQPTPLRSVLDTELSLRDEAYPEAVFVRPDGIPDVEVVANDMLNSVFRNLLNNAVQHNDTNEPIVEIACDVRDVDVVVRIADNGPGIPNDRKESVFGKGEKSLESSGTGVGLFLVETLVDQYDGDVWVEDNDPTGTVFCVQLPRAD